MSTRLRVAAILLVGLVCALGALAKTEFYALVIQSLQPPKTVQLEKFELNESDELHRLLSREAPASLTRDQYEKLPKVPLTDVLFFRVTTRALQVRSRTGTDYLALPREFKAWPKGPGPVDPAVIIRGSNLAGKLPTKADHREALKEGMVVYLFAASPGAEAVQFAVAEAQNTQQGWEDFLQKWPRGSRAPDAAKPLVEIYLNRAREAVNRYEAALTEKKPGYGNLADARKWLNEALKWIGMVRPPPPPLSDVQDKLTQRETDVRDRVNRARLQAENNECPAAGQTLEPLLHFQEELPELATTIEANQEVCARHHVNRARELRLQKKFDEAERELEAAAAYKRLPEIDRERDEIAKQRVLEVERRKRDDALRKAQEAVGRNDYAAAFRGLYDTAAAYANDTELQAYFAEVQRKYGEELVKKSEDEEKLYSEDLTDEASLLNVQVELERLLKLAPPPELSARLRVRRDALAKVLAEYFYKQYAEMTKGTSAGTNPNILAFAYLQQACRYGPERCPGDLPTQRARVERELRVGVALRFSDVSPTSAGGPRMEAELQNLVTSAIEKSGLPRVDVVEKGAEGADLEYIIELTEADARDEARSEQVASEYSAGQAPNPKWTEAKAAYDAAENNAQQTRSRIQNPKPPKGYGKKEKEADQATLPRLEAAARAAKANLDSIPQTVEDVRPYQFARRNVTRTAELRVNTRWVNVATKVRDEPRTWGEGEGEKEVVQGVQVSEVKEGDKRGNANKPLDIPDRTVLLPRLLRKIEQLLADHAVSYLKTSFIGGYFEQGRLRAARGERQGAAEDYIRFLYNSPPGADPTRREQAVAYLRELRVVALDWVEVPR